MFVTAIGVQTNGADVTIRSDRTISSLINWSIGWSSKGKKRKIWVYQWLLTFKLYHFKKKSLLERKYDDMMARYPDKELFNRFTIAWRTLSVLVIILWPGQLIRSRHLYLNHTHNVLRSYFALLSDQPSSLQDASEVTLKYVYQSCFVAVAKIRTFYLSHYLHTDATFILSWLWNVFGFSLKPFVQTNITFGDVVMQRVIHHNSKLKKEI